MKAFEEYDEEIRKMIEDEVVRKLYFEKHQNLSIPPWVEMNKSRIIRYIRNKKLNRLNNTLKK